jgi:UDP-galactopyranose mutase
LIYTGPIDSYYSSKGLPNLEYRSLRFEVERFFNYGYYQQGVQVNYPGLEYPYTRIVEYKHLPYPKTEHTYIVREYPTDIGDPYYPVPTKENQALYETYKALAEKESCVHMIGRSQQTISILIWTRQFVMRLIILIIHLHNGI